MPAHKKHEGKKKKGKSGKAGSSDSCDSPSKLAVGTPVDFLYKTMIERDPRKRKVKPVDHKNFQSFDLMEETSSDDSDYQPKNEKTADDEDDDDDDDDDVDLDEEDDNDDGDEDDEDGSSSEDGERESGSKECIKKQENGMLDKKAGAVSDLWSTAASSVDEREKASAKFSAIRICAVCCGDQSADSDEIVECDSCAITVHENCYGIIPGYSDLEDTESDHSDLSSCSTEPWFCDACKAGVLSSRLCTTPALCCDLCPNLSGIFKQTDAGRWVHVVCALYVTGVAFSDTVHLTGITLSELPVERWGAKPCSLCEDERFSRTGVTISCDAGLCRTFFHVTCAQREGLLQEVQDMSQEADAVDPFIAHCKLHAADKHAVKSKKRNFLSLQSRIRFKKGSMASLSSRTLKRLTAARSKYLATHAKPRSTTLNALASPVKKAARMLTTSPAAVRILMRKAELMGFSDLSHALSQQVTDIRKKWGVAPAFSVEFVSYFLDRDLRIRTMQSQMQRLYTEEQQLKERESQVMAVMNDVVPRYDAYKKKSLEVREKARSFWSKLMQIAGPEPQQQQPLVHLPAVFESPVKEHSNQRRNSVAHAHNTGSVVSVTQNGHPVRPRTRGRPPAGSGSPVKTSLSQELDWKECGICRKSVDQHLRD